MKKRDVGGIIEAAEHTQEVLAIGQELSKLRAALVATMCDQQMDLFRLYDDAAVTEGTARVQAVVNAISNPMAN